MNNSDTKEISPSLLSYINETIAAKVSEKFDSLRPQIEQALRNCHRGGKQTSNRATIVVFSGEMDKLLAAFVIATGAAAMGMEVSMYFTFWGLAALKKRTIFKGKSITEKLMGVMLPSSPNHLGTSRMNMFGIGPAFFKYIMRKKNVETLPSLIVMAQDMGVRMIACGMSMEMVGIGKDELIENIDYGGATTYLADAGDSKITLFI
jgi:peroxiredoxin family protein